PKPRIIKKSLLASPFAPQKWPTVEEDCRSKLLRCFKAAKSAWGPSNEWRNHVVLGFNAVTRALEKAQLAAILLNLSADPPRLLHGIIRLARRKDVPVLCVRCPLDFIGQPEVSSLLAMGVLSTPEPSAELRSFVHLVTENSEPVDSAVEAKPSTAIATGCRGAVEKKPRYSKVPKPPTPNLAGLYVVEKEAQNVPLFDSHIELLDENALGFPDYGARNEEGPSVFEKGEVPVEKKAAKRTAIKSDGQAKSRFIETNVKQVFSRGRLKEKRNKLKSKPSAQ
ncbi:unnamed protein product, partial [Ixodes hexagonus]